MRCCRSQPTAPEASCQNEHLRQHLPMEHRAPRYDFHDKPADYARLRAELAALLAGEHDLVANAANTAALLFNALPEVNWAGFYFLRGGELVLGPFQGKPACVRIALGRGVCGAAAVQR